MSDERPGRPSEPILKKVYYSIGEVCELTGLKPHVLRYWESQFPELKPHKNRAGNRVFRPQEIEMVLLVRQLLYEEKFTLEGARQRLKEMKRLGSLEAQRQEVLAPGLLQGIREELESLREILTLEPPPRSSGTEG
jgi:DNA-binding transcriptional MerR regulator